LPHTRGVIGRKPLRLWLWRFVIGEAIYRHTGTFVRAAKSAMAVALSCNGRSIQATAPRHSATQVTCPCATGQPHPWALAHARGFLRFKPVSIGHQPSAGDLGGVAAVTSTPGPRGRQQTAATFSRRSTAGSPKTSIPRTSSRQFVEQHCLFLSVYAAYLPSMQAGAALAGGRVAPIGRKHSPARGLSVRIGWETWIVNRIFANKRS
jgi:hypothetical protein